MKNFLKFLLFVSWWSTVVVMPHEMGHYAAMRMCGVQVTEIALGFGPTLISHTTPSGLVVSLKPILLGGFTSAEPSSLAAVSASQAVFIFAAGMLVNAVLAFLSFLVLGYAGKTTFRVREGSPKRFRSVAGKSVMLTAVRQSFVEWLITPWVALVSFVNVVIRRIPEETIHLPVPARDRPAQKVSRSYDLLATFALFNVLIAGFNLLPFVPLDGGRLAAVLIGLPFGDGAERWVIRWSFFIGIALWNMKTLFGVGSRYDLKKKHPEKKPTNTDDSDAAR